MERSEIAAKRIFVASVNTIDQALTEELMGAIPFDTQREDLQRARDVLLRDRNFVIGSVFPDGSKRYQDSIDQFQRNPEALTPETRKIVGEIHAWFTTTIREVLDETR